MNNEMNTLVVIDDTGSPSCNVASRFLHEKRKTYVAMILNPQERKYAQEQLEDCLDFLKKEMGKTEFHFADIYNRRGEWKYIDRKIVLAIFSAFAEIFHNFRPPIIVQTCDPNFFRDNGIVIKGKIRIDGLDLHKYDDFALFFLLMRCRWFLSRGKYPFPVDFVIDEGRYRNGHVQKSSLLRGIASNDQFIFKSSKNFIMLQLVDFVAFCLNRMQHLMVKGRKRTEFDKEFLKIMSYAHLNFMNIEKLKFDESELEKIDKKWYDDFQFQIRIKDGSWMRKQMLENIEKLDLLKFLPDKSIIVVLRARRNQHNKRRKS